MKKNKRIIITAGGTAGHIYPAVSIIEYLRENFDDINLLFIGTARGMENELIPQTGVDFIAVRASGFSASSNFFKKVLIYLKFFLNLISGFFSSIRTILKFRPDIIIGMGGYVCAPVLSAAVVLRIPFAIHEQNSVPGRLNKYFSKFAKYIFISFEASKSYFLKKKKEKACIIHSGNPIRKAVRGYYKLEPEYESWGLEERRKTVVAFGGSLGAKRINDSVLGLYDFFRYERNIQIILISGKRFHQDCIDALEEKKGVNDDIIFRILPYVNEMEKLYRIADLLISRSGAITVAEIDFTGIYSILIPYPEAIENHQFYNAQYLAEKKMAKIISDSELNSGILFNEVEKFLLNDVYFKKDDGKVMQGELSVNYAEKIISDFVTD